MIQTPIDVHPNPHIPIVFSTLHTWQDVADLLEVEQSTFNRIVNWDAARFPYSTFDVPKKNGGTRTIFAPHYVIKGLQRRLARLLLDAYRVRIPVHGFVNERDIRSNARIHRGRRWILNVDLADFFPSISFGRVRAMFMAEPYHVGEGAATTLARLCCHEGRLPQGAPTSPIIANMICVGLDDVLRRLADKHVCVYTRYADDLTFSTSNPTFPLELAYYEPMDSGVALRIGRDLETAIASKGFTHNPRKLRLQHKTKHQEVTGLTVNTRVNVSRRYLDEVRGILHAWKRYGLSAAQAEFEARYNVPRSRNPYNDPPNLPRVVRGKIEFIRAVKGFDSSTFRLLANRLNALDPKLMTAYPPPVPRGQDRWRFFTSYYRHRIHRLTMAAQGRADHGTAFIWNPLTAVTAGHCVDGNVWLDFMPDDQELTGDCLVPYRVDDGLSNHQSTKFWTRHT